MTSLADDPRHLTAVASHFQNHERWCEDALTIRNQQGFLVPFRTFPAPAKINAAVEKQRKLKRPVRLLVLKSRRAFASAGISTQIFKHTGFMPGRHAAVIAHKVDSAIEIFQYYQDFSRYYRPVWPTINGGVKLPPLAKSGQGERSIAWSEDRWIKVFAGIKDVGRGVGLHALHISEAAYIANLANVSLGLLNTMGDHPETMAFKETTANGSSGDFYEEWQDAINPRSGSAWEAVFSAWHEHPINVLALSVQPDQFERSLSQEERDLRQTYGLNQQQLNWRRWAIQNKCNRSVLSFHQEYPSCPEEAFLLSGRPRFNHISLSRHPVIREPITGNLVKVDTGTKTMVRFEPTSDGTGALLLYRRPQPGVIYTIGADVASGKDPNFKAAGDGQSDPDYCSATVLDCSSGEQVAKIRERWTPPLFAEWLCLLGWWYNWAYLVPEANNHGQAVITELLRFRFSEDVTSYPLDKIHVRRRLPGDRRPIMLNEIGFLTNATTRPDLISGLDRALDEMSVIVRDVNTIAECRKMVIWPDGVARAQTGRGNHDDDVISLALAVVGLTYAPRLQAEAMRRKQQAQDPDGGALRNAAKMIRYGQNARRGVRDDD